MSEKSSTPKQGSSLQFGQKNLQADIKGVDFANGYAQIFNCPEDFHKEVHYDPFQFNGKEAVAHRLDAHEAEKKRIARELHDGLGQLLTNIKLRAQLCQSELESIDKLEQQVNTRETLESLTDLVSEAIQEVRTVCTQIRPSILDDLGVLAAIRSHCRRCGESTAEVAFTTAFSLAESDIPEATKTAIYRIVQEATNNSLKYADAHNIRVSLDKDTGHVLLAIEDDGVGFDKMKAQPGFGLICMRERVEALCGTFNITSAKGLGVKVSASFPIKLQRLI